MANIDLAVGCEVGNFKKLVVQKTIREEFTKDPDLVSMFLDEARLCARLNHQNLVQVYEVLESPRPCLVMEYLEGLSYARIQQQLGAAFTCNLQLRIICDALAGLHHAHEMRDFEGVPLGIVHRDVSPQNIVITSDGRVKVVDFGIAKTVNSPNYTLAGMVKGKLSYMSPEQLAGETLDRRTDVFAVGCMLWRAASGRKLWSKVPPEEIMSCLVTGNIPPPSIHRPVEPRLEAIVTRATAAAREQRYATADELRRDLERYLSDIGFAVELRDWMQVTFEEQWVKERQLVNLAFAEFASIPPVGIDERLSVPAVPEAPEPARTPQRRVLHPGWLAVAAAVLTLGVASLKQRAAVNVDASEVQRVTGLATDGVRVRLRTTPETALVSMDATPITQIPREVRVAAGSEHLFQVTLPNYQTIHRQLRIESDTTIEFDMAPTPEPDASPEARPNVSGEPVADEPPLRNVTRMARMPAQQVPTEPAPTEPVPPHEDVAADQATPEPPAGTRAEPTPAYDDPCQPPFYFKNGIKTYKPECLK
jgi:hypothetical protein